MSSVHPSTFSTPSDFLTATVSLQSQTVRQAAEVANRTEVEAGAGAKKTVQALLDTGSLAGNFISQAIITDLQAENYVYRTKRTFSVCSGLDSVCYSSDKMINLLLTYNNERTQKIQSIFLKAFVAQNSPIDLIIGRSSIKKHHFPTSNPSHFMSSAPVNSHNKNSTLTVFQKAKPSETNKSVALENGHEKNSHPETPIFPRLKNTNSCVCTSPLLSPRVASEGVTFPPMNLDSDRSDFCDLNHNLSDTHPLPAGPATSQRHGWVASVLRQAHLQHTFDDFYDRMIRKQR